MKTNYLLTFVLVITMLVLLSVQPLLAQEMTKDQWQEEMKTYTARRAELQTRLTNLDNEVKQAKANSEQLDADVRACEDALFSLLGVTREQYEAFVRDLEAIEKRIPELQAMSDERLMNYRDEITKMESRLNDMKKNKIALIPRINTRITTAQEKVAALLKTLAGREKSYTVGTWARDRDCLWNIAKKKDIYNNAWLWPKIWQGNRDKIKDPDIIQPKWVLKIPAGNELTKEEKSAANSYYRKKAASAPSGASD